MSVLFSRKFMAAAALLLLTLGARGTLQAQGAATAKAAGPIDLTGYWVAVVTEDWRWRMVTPAKGDYASIPITAEAKKAADLWDPAKDEAAGEQCKSYGAPALMRIPARLHITWQDDATLKVEVDAGTQTRLLHFGDWKSDQKAATWQGDSLARWETPRAPAGGNAEGAAKAGNLKCNPFYGVFSGFHPLRLKDREFFPVTSLIVKVYHRSLRNIEVDRCAVRSRIWIY